MSTLRAEQVMTREVATVAADWSVDELETFLVDHGVSGAPVVDREGRVVGVVSATDVLRASSERASPVRPRARHDEAARGVDPAELRVDERSSLTVGDIMTPVVFEVAHDATIQEVSDVMVRGRIHRVVVMQDGRMVGLISALDLVGVLRDRSGG